LVSEILGSGNYFTSCLSFPTFSQTSGQVIQSMHCPFTSTCCLCNSGFAIMRSFFFSGGVMSDRHTMPKIHANRPFAFFIVENSLRVIIFAGKVVNPHM